MASISGSQFTASSPPGALPIVVTETTGTPPPTPTAGAFNLEVYTGPLPAPTSPAPGFQGLAVLNSADEITLISGAFAVTDNGSGGDTLITEGDNETISGNPDGASATLVLDGSGD